MGASASFESPSISVEPGGAAQVQLRVRNTGDVVDSFTFEPVGVPADWVSVEPAEVRLFPQTEEFVTVTVAPPRAADTPLGELTFALRVISAEDPDGSIAEELTVLIAAFEHRFGELYPKTSTGRTKGVHELAVDNHGNTPISPEFSGVDADDRLTFEIKPPTTTIEAGQAAIAIVTVRPKKRFWRGQPKTLPFQIVVSQPDEEPELIDGNFVQQPMIPKWLWKALLLLLALLILAWILWKTVLEPQVESTARDSVEELVDERDEAIDERLDAAGIPELGEEPAAEPPAEEPPAEEPPAEEPPAETTTPETVVPETTTPPTGPTTTGVGTTTTAPTTTAAPITDLGPIDFRIQVTDPPGGPGTIIPQPFPDTRFELTDIVFQNPEGATGSVLVRRNGQPLFDIGLANFRDLDYHFVAPIVFEPGDNVDVVLVCDTAGTLNPVDSPGNCTVAVLFAGFNSAG